MTKRKTTARRVARKGLRRAPSAAAMAPGRSQFKQLSLLSLRQNPSSQSAASGPSWFQRRLDGEEDLDDPDQIEGDEMDCILSQDFFCTPDYITPEGPQIPNNFETNKENISCPRSPEKSTNPRSRGQRQDISLESFACASLNDHQNITEDRLNDTNVEGSSCKKRNYVPKSAVSLRCRVMPPPCIKNPYSKDSALMDMNIFGDKRSKISGNLSQLPSGGSLSRYRAEFHEIEQVGCGNFSRVFKVIKRIDGCMYAVKQSIRQLRQDTIRRRALMEVQALAALGPHENIVGYYSSWFENENLYIQMELCDRCLCINKSLVPSIDEILKALYQVAKALEFMHGRGIAHLDVKPDNIYIKNGIYKLGDFGCATLIDRSLPIDEGDSRYMPMEIINDRYEYLDKVDVFSLGIATYELLRGSPLPESGQQFSNFREGKIPPLPGVSLQFQNLLQSMMDPEPVKRPTAREVREHPIFDQSQRK
ncbi:WEE1-like kinase [Wolffia australiana]